MAFSVEIAKGFRIDMRRFDIEKLEVDHDVLIRGDLKVKGTAETYLTEYHYADLEVHDASVKVFSGEVEIFRLDPITKKLEVLEGADINLYGADGADKAALRGNAVGLLIQTKDATGVWTDRLEVSGTVDVADFKLTNAVQKVVPSSAGAEALVVRDVTDLENRIALKEDGSASFIGDVGANRFKTANLMIKELAADRYGIRDATDTLDRGLYVAFLIAKSLIEYATSGLFRTDNAATAYINLQSHDGVDYVDCAKLLGGYIELARAKLTGNLIQKAFDAGSTVSVDAGVTYTVPEGVYYVICGTNTSVEIYDDVAAVWVTLISAGGVGMFVSDGSNVRLYNAGVAAESSTLRRAF
jgi:hypothetical protein